MARLTSYDVENDFILVKEEERLLSAKGFIDKDEMYKIMRHLAEKLYEYENAEENGLILRSPIGIGDIVYRINEFSNTPIIPMGVVSIEFKGITDTFKEIKCKECVFGGENFYRFTDIGKTIFLTKEDAESRLKELV